MSVTNKFLYLDPADGACKASIDGGFTSVMIDASSHPWEENIAITKKVVEYAHDHGVVVEAELGTTERDLKDSPICVSIPEVPSATTP